MRKERLAADPDAAAVVAVAYRVRTEAIRESRRGQIQGEGIRRTLQAEFDAVNDS
jgi:hypothetical protein